jgi:hypothetical protein
MKKSALVVVEYQGVIVSLLELARIKGFNLQTIVDRWHRLGRPQVVDDAGLFYPAAIGSASALTLTLNGQPTDIHALVKLTGLSVPMVYKRIKEHGHDLLSEHLHVNRSKQQRARGAHHNKRLAAKEAEAADKRGYDPADRSPGWCERKYDFLRRAGQNGYAAVDRSIFCGRTSSGGSVYGGGQ